MIKYHFLIFIFLVSVSLYSQSELAIGEWKSHLSYRQGQCITQSNDKIIYAASSGIFTINKSDLSPDFLSKEDGLSDVLVADIFYDPYNEQLIIIYEDSNIDILRGSNVINIPYIQTNTTIIGDKSINDCFFIDPNHALMATDFGVLGFNAAEFEFSYTTFTPVSVLSVAAFGNYLYAGTDSGLYKISQQASNPSDFNQWQRVKLDEDISVTASITDMGVKFGSLFVLAENKVYRMNADTSFSLVFEPEDAEEDVSFVSDSGQDLMIGVTKNNDGRIIYLDSSGQITAGSYGCAQKLSDAVQDETGRVWFADIWEPIKYLDNKSSVNCNRILFPSPYSNQASSIQFRDNKAYFGSNGVTEDYGYAFNLSGYYVLDKNEWTNYTPKVIPELETLQFLNLKVLLPIPDSKEIYLGSYFNGLIKYNEETKEVKHWNKDNSLLQETEGDILRTRVAGLALDKNHNLWISNFGASKPLVLKTKEDQWYSFFVPGTSNFLNKIAIDNQGNKWISVYGVGGGVIVFNEGNDLANTQDDKKRNINKNNSVITGNKVNCVAVDLDGSVWIGTDQGPVVFEKDPFDEDYKGSTRIVVVDGIPAPLLRYEDVISIAVDGANRKWFGTRNGIFVQSPDGATQIAKYDVKNSPLLDNRVDEMAYNPKTGEMFIITKGGIQSVKTTTTGGGTTFTSNVYAYPNPVTPDYYGPIAIKGLARNANVKITDVNGRLVYETTALGGQAVWDGKDYNGVVAAPGVYMVFTAIDNTSLTPEALVTKILIVR
ncbi:MAG: hypothetical protein J5I52_12030 [Saprospiraceae bacterium]|nr:MAG: two component regulator propeller domain-containing protein [Bacteroidetes bacterium OLB9]MCO6464865.1 hypothetical protein [Saprospiraceae bacterium]MCZ2336968.1 hypothetical protein [Chitinophagales bacterium]